MAQQSRERILEGARGLLARGENLTVGQVATAAGVSRTSFYRTFESRRALLDALEVEPETGTRERILETALDMVGAAGLTALSMDDLAARAGVSRATLYRLFPGKPALFTAILRTYSPIEPVSRRVIEMRHEPPDVVMPEIARTIYRSIDNAGSPRVGLLRTIVVEISSLGPDAEDAARELVTTILGTVGAYVISQMAAGRLRMMNPLLALQSFVGPIFFHVLARPLAERMVGLDMEAEEAVVILANMWLRAMKPDEEGDSDG